VEWIPAFAGMTESGGFYYAAKKFNRRERKSKDDFGGVSLQSDVQNVHRFLRFF